MILGGAVVSSLPKCTCCPYGFHIDLDFLQYCENLVNSPPSDGQRIRRDRRRQRKSMEVMLGLEEIARWEHAGKLTQYPLQEVQQTKQFNHASTNRILFHIGSGWSWSGFTDRSSSQSDSLYHSKSTPNIRLCAWSARRCRRWLWTDFGKNHSSTLKDADTGCLQWI